MAFSPQGSGGGDDHHTHVEADITDLANIEVEKGTVTTDIDGLATISFSGSYSSKPVLTLTPELPVATDRVSVQIESWTGPPYTAVTIATSDDSGKAEPSVLIHWVARKP